MKFVLLDGTSARADLELADGLTINNVVYAPAVAGSRPRVLFPETASPNLWAADIDKRWLARPTATLPGWLKTLVVSLFDERIEAEIQKRIRKQERRTARKGEPLPEGYVSVVDGLDDSPGGE
ncbi:MAG: hypothetical protein ABL949_04380 [Fimbriimonadaceae bacterium]